MNKGAFDPKRQNTELAAKITAGLERISEVYKVLLWNYAKELQLSPIQIQILLFVKYHDERLTTVSHLAKEFNITKATVSDAVRVMLKKELLTKERSALDNRSFSLRVAAEGNKVVLATQEFASPIEHQLNKFSEQDKVTFYRMLQRMIFGLNKSGFLSVQRTCFACKFHEKREGQSFCNFLNSHLKTEDIRLDCPEFEEMA
ncbi:MAG: helix-turn-helix domain-containing protein [Bacteroidota bacterium]